MLPLKLTLILVNFLRDRRPDISRVWEAHDFRAQKGCKFRRVFFGLFLEMRLQKLWGKSGFFGPKKRWFLPSFLKILYQIFLVYFYKKLHLFCRKSSAFQEVFCLYLAIYSSELSASNLMKKLRWKIGYGTSKIDAHHHAFFAVCGISFFTSFGSLWRVKSELFLT